MAYFRQATRGLWLLIVGGLLLLLGASQPALAQERAELRGTITDAETGEAIPGASVLLTATGAGVAADADGRYVLRTAPGTKKIRFSAVGYEPAMREVTLTAEEPQTLDVALAPDVVALEQVQVTAGRRQPLRDTRPSITAVSPEQVQALPGAAEDVLRSLQTTPGVLAASDFSSQLIVRGGGPDQNLIILDDVEVFNPYRLYGVVSMFNPATVSNLTLYTGGFPARYGDRLSAALDVQSRDGDRESPLGGSFNASLANANLVMEGKTGVWDGSWLVTGRRTYYDLVIGLLARELEAVGENTRFPNFADLQGRLTLRPAKGHRIRVGGIISRDALDIAVEGALDDRGSEADRVAAEDLTRNDVAYATYDWTPTPALNLQLTASTYRNAGDLASAGNIVPRDAFDGSEIVAANDTVNAASFAYNQSFLFQKHSLLQRTTLEVPRQLIEVGGGVDWLETTLQFDLNLNDVGRALFESFQQDSPFGVGAFPEQFDQGERYYRYHAYAQTRVELLPDRLFVQPGLRLDYYRLIDRSYLSPRLSASLRLTDATTLRGAWGRYVQSPGFEKLLDDPQAFDLSEDVGLQSLQAEVSYHYVLGLTHWLDDRYQARVEGYVKTFDDLIVQDRGRVTRAVARFDDTRGLPRTNPDAYDVRIEDAVGLTTRPVNDAEGGAYGLEVSLEKQRSAAGDRFTGWISYAYAQAARSRTRQEAPGSRITFPFDYDRRHTLNVVVNTRLGQGWTLGTTFRMGTGFPYTPAVDAAPVVVRPLDVDDPEAETEPTVLTNSETGLVRFEPGYGDAENLNSARLPLYHRLDVRLSRDVNVFGMPGEAYLDVINVYNRGNVLAYQYAAVTDLDAPEADPRLERQSATMLPILPTLGFNFRF